MWRGVFLWGVGGLFYKMDTFLTLLGGGKLKGKAVFAVHVGKFLIPPPAESGGVLFSLHPFEATTQKTSATIKNR